MVFLPGGLYRGLRDIVRKTNDSVNPVLTFDRIPLDIPGNTKVPPWAYLDVTVCARSQNICSFTEGLAGGR